MIGTAALPCILATGFLLQNSVFLFFTRGIFWQGVEGRKRHRPVLAQVFGSLCHQGTENTEERGRTGQIFSFLERKVPKLTKVRA